MKTRRLALCAVLSALGTAFLWMGSALDFLDLTFACAASLICVFAVIELRGSAPWLIYGVTAVLSLIVVPVKFTALEYIAFTGIYPIIKYHLERKVRQRVLLWFMKLVYAGVMLSLLLLAARLLLASATLPLLALTALLGMAAFVLYDIALTLFISLYFHKWRDKLRIERLLK